MLFFFAAYTIDSTRREIRQGDDVIHVEPQVFDLLLYLIENRDRVVGKKSCSMPSGQDAPCRRQR